jgi:hypothetical protein
MSKPKDFNRDAELVWGCVPVDWRWAIQTEVYKEYKKLNKL